jgi:small subunit ribosomal protein S2
MKEAKIATELDNNEKEALQEEPSLTAEEKNLFDEMMSVGVFYGRFKSKTNPLMREYILASRSGFEILDLYKTIERLKSAGDALKEVVKKGGVVLLVGTSSAAKFTVKETAERLGLPYVSERWLGGTITNFDTIKKRINFFKKLKGDSVSGKLEKYTKKERVTMNRELNKLEKLLGGIESLDSAPGLVLITDVYENKFAAREAKQKGIPTIGILSTDTSPKLVTYPIPSNDRNTKSIKLIIDYLEKSINDGRSELTRIKASDANNAEKLKNSIK